MDPLDVPACAVSIESEYAINVAHKYLELVEVQISQAEADLHSAAIEAYRRIAEPNETDYQDIVGHVETSFAEDYRPILRFTAVIYLYLLFETYIVRHVDEIEREQGRKEGALDTLRRQLTQRKNKMGAGLVEAARTYFRDHARWSLLTSQEWEVLREIAEVRNCIVHNAGVARRSKSPGFIYRLESRRWRGRPVGVQILRSDDGREFGPIIIHQSFIQYYVSLLEKLFASIAEKTFAQFWDKRRRK
jgi:hypothetical protein